MDPPWNMARVRKLTNGNELSEQYLDAMDNHCNIFYVLHFNTEAIKVYFNSSFIKG